MIYTKQDLIDVLYEITDGRWFTTDELDFHHVSKVFRIRHINTTSEEFSSECIDTVVFNTNDIEIKDTLLRLEDMGFNMYCNYTKSVNGRYYCNQRVSGELAKNLLIPSKDKPLTVNYIDIIIP